MPPLPATSAPPIPGWKPRVVCYFQTYHDNGEYVSLLPLITKTTGVTHVILAAIHVNEDPGKLSLNDTAADDPVYTQLWDEVLVLQDSGIKVMGMLGGAAKGTYARLDYSESRTDIPKARFESYYAPLRDMIKRYSLDGLDLDVEEEMSLPGIVHLIDRLRADFGPAFLISLAPVATALMVSRPHLSGFDYQLLEAARGSKIDWYNAQFYNGWGNFNDTKAYDEIIQGGWKPERIVAGLLTNPRHGGSGYVPLAQTASVLGVLVERYQNFGGVMGWEYWKALPGEENENLWKWPFCISLCMGMRRVRDTAVVAIMGQNFAGIDMESITG